MLDKNLSFPIEYWRLRIPFAIARVIRIPLAIDGNKKFEYYARRILVDMDVFEFLPKFLLVERCGV
jgi:hypothetical protein